MQTPRLNADILATIISVADWDEIPVMMQACRLFYHEGPKRLLDGCVTLDCDEEFLVFFQFMRAEGGTRSRYLTDLAIIPIDHGDAICEETAQLLAQFLHTSSFPRLTTLRIEDTEDLFTRYPFLLPAFKTLPRLEELTLVSCDRLACELVDAVGGRLRDVTLAYTEEYEEPMATPVEDIHPLVTLQSSRTTLEKLEVRFMDATLPESLFPPPFPNVAELVIAWCAYPSLALYIHAFPNLRCLGLKFTISEDDFINPGVQANGLRQANRTHQLQHSSWKSLDDVFGNVTDVYISGLACHVKRLNITLQHTRSSNFEMLGDIVNDTRPLNLSVWVGCEGAFNSVLGVPYVLRKEGVKKLEVFQLEVRLVPEESDIDLSEALVCIQLHSDIEHVRLTPHSMMIGGHPRVLQTAAPASCGPSVHLL